MFRAVLFTARDLEPASVPTNSREDEWPVAVWSHGEMSDSGQKRVA